MYENNKWKYSCLVLAHNCARMDFRGMRLANWDRQGLALHYLWSSHFEPKHLAGIYNGNCLEKRTKIAAWILSQAISKKYIVFKSSSKKTFSRVYKKSMHTFRHLLKCCTYSKIFKTVKYFSRANMNRYGSAFFLKPRRCLGYFS